MYVGPYGAISRAKSTDRITLPRRSAIS